MHLREANQDTLKVLRDIAIGYEASVDDVAYEVGHAEETIERLADLFGLPFPPGP